MLLKYAPMAELADAPDLGSGVPDVKVRIFLYKGLLWNTNTSLELQKGGTSNPTLI